MTNCGSLGRNEFRDGRDVSDTTSFNSCFVFQNTSRRLDRVQRLISSESGETTEKLDRRCTVGQGKIRAIFQCPRSSEHQRRSNRFTQ
eukprot:4007828-Pleurochrysis_carterae.AAC.9